MDRRRFISNSMWTAVTASFAARSPLLAESTSEVPAEAADSNAAQSHGHDLNRHRFGLNYTPSANWWFCWNDWNPDPIKRDLDEIASLGADHLRILLLWPYFQPNPAWVSPVQMDRLNQLLTLMGERNLDAVVTVFTGQLSGWFFLPPFNKAGSAFFTSDAMWAAQEVFIRQLAPVMKAHTNIIGFDIGNEINTCWSTEPSIGDAWMAKMFSLMESVYPAGLNVNGVDEYPWFESTTFSPHALAARPMPTMHCYPYFTGALKHGGPMDPPSTELLAAMAALIRSYAGDAHKPIWAEEFNICGVETLTDIQQGQWIEKAVLAAIDSGVSWFTYWDSHDLDPKFKFNSLEYKLGVLTNDGRVKPQGKVFQQLANAYRGKAVTFSKRPIAPPPVNRTFDTAWQWMLDWIGWKPKTP